MYGTDHSLSQKALQSMIAGLFSASKGKNSFLPEQQREIVLSNASSDALLNAQNAFSGLADKLGNNDEDDVQSLVDSVR